MPEIIISGENATQIQVGDKIEVVNIPTERVLGTFKEELNNFLTRAEKIKPFLKDEVIILGMGGSRSLCPFDAEVWGVNWGYIQVAQMGGHIEKIFMAHTQIKNDFGQEMFPLEEYNQMHEAGIQVFNTHRVKGQKATIYPLKRMIKKYKTDFFTDTICYMIVYAIDKGYKKIRLYGCDMRTQEEYAWEKGGIEYWIGYARGLGLTVEVCENSALLRTITGKPYGIKYWKMKDIDPFGVMRKKRKNIKPETPRPTPWVRM